MTFIPVEMRLLAYPMCGHLAYTGYLMGVQRCRAMCAPRSARLIEMKNHFLIRETIKSQDLNEKSVPPGELQDFDHRSSDEKGQNRLVYWIAHVVG